MSYEMRTKEMILVRLSQEMRTYCNLRSIADLFLLYLDHVVYSNSTTQTHLSFVML